MSIYNAAVSEGVNALQIAFTGSSAETDAYYNAVYKTKAGQRAASEKREALRGSLSLIHQEKILTNQNIRLNQASAEAAVKVQAALSGVSGKSVADMAYQTKKNAAFAKASLEKSTNRSFENLLAEIGNATNSMLSIQDVKEPSMAGAILGVAGQFSAGDIKSIINHKTQTGIDDQLKLNEEDAAYENELVTWGKF